MKKIFFFSNLTSLKFPTSSDLERPLRSLVWLIHPVWPQLTLKLLLWSSNAFDFILTSILYTFAHFQNLNFPGFFDLRLPLMTSRLQILRSFQFFDQDQEPFIFRSTSKDLNFTLFGNIYTLNLRLKQVLVIKFYVGEMSAWSSLILLWKQIISEKNLTMENPLFWEL